ncbi:MAG TPA: mechanosensitive ion channel family protein [Gammaproteobacteria bacterium]
MELPEFLENIGNIPGGWGLAAKVFAIVFIALILDMVQRIVTSKLGAKTRSTVNPWDDALFDAIRKPASVFIWLVGITLAAELISRQTEAEVYFYVDEARAIGVVTILAWFLLRFIRKVENNFIQKRIQQEAQFDQTAVDAIGKLMRASVVITAVLVLMQTLGFSIGGILAFGGIGGIAIGFAAKDMLANFFGGMTVYLDKPFKVGDWIRSPDKEIEGTVERIGWRSTRIRTFDQRPLYVPNAVFSNIVVENPSRMFARRIFETIGIRYDDFDNIEGIVNDVREMMSNHEGIDQKSTLMVNFDAFGESGVNFFIYAFTTTRVWAEYHEIKQDVLLKIGRIIDGHGAKVALPTRRLLMPEALRLEGAERGDEQA